MVRENENQCRFHWKSEKIDSGINLSSHRLPMIFPSSRRELRNLADRPRGSMKPPIQSHGSKSVESGSPGATRRPTPGLCKAAFFVPERRPALTARDG